MNKQFAFCQHLLDQISDLPSTPITPAIVFHAISFLWLSLDLRCHKLFCGFGPPWWASVVHGVNGVSTGLWKTSDLLTSGLAPLIMTFCWCSTAVNTKCFILKINLMFYLISVLDFLSWTICTVLNCCVVLQHSAMRICISAAVGSGSPELQQSRNAAAATAAASGSTHIDLN